MILLIKNTEVKQYMSSQQQKKQNSADTSTEKRRKLIKEELTAAEEPITAVYLSEKFSVSRQIIVGDIAILRASGLDIIATPKGYIMQTKEIPEPLNTEIIACRHSSGQLRDELYTIVDFGATVIDVTIEHAIYGELSGKLNLSSRYDVDMFLKKIEKEKNSAPISSLTDGVHLHRISCNDKNTFNLIKDALRKMNILID